MNKDPVDTQLDELRLDKWLWAARFFKTRGIAIKAINGGKVHVAGQRVKPAKTVRIGDVLSIRKGIYEFEITVEKINDKRRPASEAQTMYTESEESLKQRQLIALQRRMESEHRRDAANEGRPTKKQRRQIIRFKKILTQE